MYSLLALKENLEITLQDYQEAVEERKVKAPHLVKYVEIQVMRAEQQLAFCNEVALWPIDEDAKYLLVEEAMGRICKLVVYRIEGQ